MPLFNTAHTEYTRSISDYVRLYCLNSEIFGVRSAGVLSVFAAIWGDDANIGNILGLCTADVIAIMGSTCLAVSTLILRLLVELKYILNTPSILRV